MSIAVRIPVTAAKPYDISIGTNLLDDIIHSLDDSTTVAVIHQPTVGELADQIATAAAGSGRHVYSFELPDAEDGKTLEIAGQCWEFLGRIEFGRTDTLIAVGGGAATDLAGFVASTWMRGVRFINIPTSLVGMVDASVGGKTGINTELGKNLVGTFYEPTAVFIDLDTLTTLPQQELTSGLAEIIKIGFIADPEILTLIEQNATHIFDTENSILPELIERAIRVKATVVSKDLHESGLREILNYGHTLGHAIERRENYQWRHGHAVAVGLCFAAALAQEAGYLDDETANKHRRILDAVGLPTQYDAEALDELHELMRRDKKNRGGKLRFVVLNGIAQPTRLVDPDEKLLAAAYKHIALTQPVEEDTASL